MNRTTLIVSGAAVIALGLTGWALLGPDSSDASSAKAQVASGSKYSDRPASKVNGSRNSDQSPFPSGAARYSNRSTSRPDETTKAKDAMNRLLTSDQRQSVAAARQNWGKAQLAGKTGSAWNTKAKKQAISQMREDLRTAVTTDPEGWISTYESLNRDFERDNGQYFGRSNNGGVPTDNPEPTEPSTPEPQAPEPETPVDPVDPVEELPELPVPIDEAQRLAEEFRQKTKNTLPGPTVREDRYKPVDQ